MSRHSSPAAAALAAALASISPEAAAADPPAPVAALVPIQGFAFMAMSTTVAVNGSVTWKNLDGEPHTVVAVDGQFRSPALDQGDSFTFRFTRPGVYRYVCSIHPQMRGTIVVR